MSNEFYNHSSYPTQGSVASSASMRAELDAVAAGFDKLPPLAGNGGKTVKINASGTGLEAVTVAGNLPLTTSILRGDGVGGAAGASAAEIVSAIGSTPVANATSASNATAVGGTTPTAAGLALLDDASASAQRTTLGLGSASTQNSTAFASAGAATGSGLTMATSRLLGRTTASSGAIEEISVGSGLSLSAGVLSSSSSGPTLDTEKNSTSGTYIDFTPIPAGTKRITVMFSGVSTSGTSQRLIRIGSGSFDTTGYVGTCADLVTTGTVVASTSTVGIPITGTSATTASASCVLSGSITITRIAGNDWVFSGSLAATGGTAAVCNFAGSKSLSGDIDRIRITTVGGSDTFDAGLINVMYE